MEIVPGARPKVARDVIENFISSKKIVREQYPVVLVGARGFYLDMGTKGENDRLLYDDAIFVSSPTVFAGFNANTDPDVFDDGVATLELGTWLYKLGIHGLHRAKLLQYEALVQALPVMVDRDKGSPERGFFGINIHRGGWAKTGSLGCQTIYPSQWDEFIACVKEELMHHNQKVIPYILTDQNLSSS